jgi:hypothetical protein
VRRTILRSREDILLARLLGLSRCRKRHFIGVKCGRAKTPDINEFSDREQERSGSAAPRRCRTDCKRGVQAGASFTQEALETLVEMMRNAELPGNVRIKAAEAVLNRGIGLPAQPVDVTVQRVLAKKLCECTIEELRAIEQHLAEEAIDVTPEADTVSADDH